MVKAIDFVVRDSAGGVVRGSVAGDGGNFVQLGTGEEISLNLSRQSVAGFQQRGSDLVVTLIDGREIVLSGYFNQNGEPNQLYLSQNGEVIAVEFSDAGNGHLIASYGPADGWDKFSTLDDLRFGNGDDLALAQGAVSEDPAGMAAFVPGLLGLGAGGAALAGLGVIGAVVGGGGGDGGGNGGRAQPTVDEPDSKHTVTTNTDDKTLDVSGTGEPGDKVTVIIGDETKETIIGEDGTWAVEFGEDELPVDGTYETEVVFEQPDGTETTLDGPTFVLDLTPPDVEVTQGAKSTGDVENLVEYANGVTIAGEGEAGAKIVVQVGDYTQTTTVGSNGSWSVTFPATQVPAGEYEVPFTVTATDPLGNQTVLNDVLVVDTVPNPIGFNPVTADNTVNGSEAAAGFQITGTSIAGATLTVTIQGIQQVVTAGADGSWSVNFAAGTLTAGEYDATINATSTDAAGNVTDTTHTFRVDTTTFVAFAPAAIAGDGVVNATEAGAGVTMTGTAQPGATVQVAWNGATLPATVAADGSWSVTFPAAGITGGTYPTTATVTATDAVGNTATATRVVQVDTETSVSVNPGQPGGDNIVSGAERVAGLTLTGHAEAGATVKVTFEGVTRTVTADASGNWTASYGAGDYRAGTYVSTVQVTATDAAGNTASTTHSLKVDTEVSPFQHLTLSTGADNVLNAAEAANGLTVTGMVEPGSTVMVRFGPGGTPLAATVAADGSWMVTVPPGQIPPGENSVAMTMTATDAVGNTSTLTETVKVDTVVSPLTQVGSIAGDDTINAAEAAAGVTIGGKVEAGAQSVVLTLSNGKVIEATVNGSNWTAQLSASDLSEGNLSYTVRAVDAAGNTGTIGDSGGGLGFSVDIVAPNAPHIINDIGSGNQLNGIQVSQPEGDLTFYSINGSGVATEIDATLTHVGGSMGSFATFDTPVPDGSYLIVRDLDAAGNEASTLYIRNTGGTTINVDMEVLSDFDFSAIDLSSAPGRLTLDADDLARLAGPDQTLMVKGGADDQVGLADASATGEVRHIDGQDYALYSLGDGLVLVDEDIKTSII
ncbi:hypothetical protein G5B31_02570 [Rhodobacter sp. SGA-6-6]|uniref:Ig-like domain-containing protein n=1 Tax=Rhodobacter sp. SGA-6-6 TaxID=2710882 RepID=UPI0013EC1388|nr:Ig-like domain-containing protein [Rhodobacter sp. SGA-6-6]NGM44417.1 hypothetical protein [Rhodobacter sp. SGA-6-6]